MLYCRRNIMQITSVRIRLSGEDVRKLKAVASVVFDDCFVVHDIKVLESANNEVFITMPNKKLPNGRFKDVAHPINSEFRNLIIKSVLDEYNLLVTNKIDVEKQLVSKETDQDIDIETDTDSLE